MSWEPPQKGRLVPIPISTKQMVHLCGISVKESLYCFLSDPLKILNYLEKVNVSSLSLAWLSCNPMKCSPLPGSPVHGIYCKQDKTGLLQARLEWVAAFFPRGSSLTQGFNQQLFCLLHWQPCSSLLSHEGSPKGQ